MKCLARCASFVLVSFLALDRSAFGAIGEIPLTLQLGAPTTPAMPASPAIQGSTGSVSLTTGQGTDSCAAPTPIAGGGPFPFDCVGATTGTQGQANGICVFLGQMGITFDVWFRWTSPSDGPVTLSTCAGTADSLDTKVAVYAGSACPGSSALACSDDDCGATQNSELTFAAVRGSTYVIQIGCYPGTSPGTGAFTMSFAPPPTACARDDGATDGVGHSAGSVEDVWMYRFGAPGEVTRVTSISTAWGSPSSPGTTTPANGLIAHIAIWDDPNDDGNPNDLVLLQLVDTTIQNRNSNILNAYALSPAVVVTGTYFVGAGTPLGPMQAAVPVDLSAGSVPGAWLFASTLGPANYANPSANGVPPGASVSAGWLLRADCEPVFTTYCEPGTGGTLACPCGNPPSGPDRGCNNHGAATGGASLSASGVPSLTADSVLLNAANENTSALTIFWTGSTQLSPPGVVHGAGVRCVSDLKRLYTGNASAGAITRPGMGDSSVHTRSAIVGASISAGQTRHYFTVYRDPLAAGPCGNPLTGINLSNAVGIYWGP